MEKYIIIFSITFIITFLILRYIRKNKKIEKEHEEFKLSKTYKEHITGDYEEVRKYKQEFINLDIDQKIDRMARQMFYDWLKAPIIRISEGQSFKNYICIFPCIITIIEIEHEETAKYNNWNNIKVDIFKKFNQLKQNYIIENPDYLEY